MPEWAEWQLSLGTTFEYWKLTYLFNDGGFVGYARGAMIREIASRGAMSNPAEMFEELHDRGGEWMSPKWTDQKSAAGLWACRGWWDEQYKSHNHPDFRVVR